MQRICPQIISLVTGAALLLAACGDLNKKPGQEAPAPPPPAAKEAPAAPAAPTLDIGDVEAKTRFNIRPAQGLDSPSAKINVMESANGAVNLVTIDLYPPYPETLPLDCLIQTSGYFKEQPVVMRGSILREQDIIGEISGIMGIDQVTTLSGTASQQVDALIGLPEKSGSLLVHGEAEALLMPRGTDAAHLDPLSADTTANAKTIILSNPVRINFHAGTAPGQEP